MNDENIHISDKLQKPTDFFVNSIGGVTFEMGNFYQDFIKPNYRTKLIF